MFDVVKTYEVSGYYGVYNENQMFKMLGDSYAHGAVLDPGPAGDVYAMYNLRGKYKSIRGILGHIDGSSDSSGVFVIELDGSVYAEYPLNPPMLTQEIFIDVTNVQLMQFSIRGAHDGSHYGFGNVTIE
jgi:hypothetical protein